MIGCVAFHAVGKVICNEYVAMNSIESFIAAEAHGSFQKIPRIEVIFKLDTCGEVGNFSEMAYVALSIYISLKRLRA